MGYRRAPDEALQSPGAMAPWLRLALGAALRSIAARRMSRRLRAAPKAVLRRARPAA